MRNIICTLCVSAACWFACGCVSSAVRFDIDDARLASEPAIVGVWRFGDDDAILRIDQTGFGWYAVFPAEFDPQNPEHAAFDGIPMVLLRVADYLALVSQPGDQDRDDGITMIWRIDDIDRDTLSVTLCSHAALMQIMDQHPDDLAHVRTDDGRYVIVGIADDLHAFLEQHINDAEMFAYPGQFRRVE